jgi:hypothetical protein
MDLTKKHLIIKPDGTAARIRIVEEPIDLTTTVLKNFADNQVVSAGVIDKDTYLGLIPRTRDTVVARQLYSLPLNGAFRLATTHEGRVEIRPVINNRAEGVVEMTNTWTVPLDTDIYFVRVSNQDVALARHLLVTVHGGRTHHIPYPNLHSDMRVCMGNSYIPKTDGGLLEKFAYDIEWFNNTRFNSDLQHDTTGKVFALDADKNTIAKSFSDLCGTLCGCAYTDWLVNV